MRRRRSSGFRGVPPYVAWPPAPRKRRHLETVACPHCEREFQLEPFRPGIRHAAEACDKVREATRGATQESFWALYLNARNRVVGRKELCRGTSIACIIHPRDLLRDAISRNATGMIVAHNHPSGDPRPSPEDEALTERLVAAGKIVGVPLLDHVVVSETGCFSLRSGGKVVF